MAEHPAEVAEITSHAQALALNLGNITDARMESMPKSLKTAGIIHIPVMLDLVGTACSTLRYEFAQKLMNIHMPELLKGNMSELLAMSGQTAHAIGIDAGTQDTLTDANRSHLLELFQEKAAQWNTTLLITGKEDMVVSADKCTFIMRGTPAMSQITGTGCMLGMICATYLAVTDPFTAAVSAATEFGIAGEKAGYFLAESSKSLRINCITVIPCKTMYRKQLKNTLLFKESFQMLQINSYLVNLGRTFSFTEIKKFLIPYAFITFNSCYSVISLKFL